MNIRTIHHPYRGLIEVQGNGAYTLWRDPSDTSSPFAGRWLLASPEFRAQIEQAELDNPNAGENYQEWPPYGMDHV